MAIADGILKSIDEEIKRLTQVRSLLSPEKVRRGRPKGSKAKVVRKFSQEGRKRISAGMRKSWAARKKAAKKAVK